jgi:hypothetical protein
MPAAAALADLGVLLALAILIGLSYAYRYSLGAAIVALAAAIGSLRINTPFGSFRLLGFVADALTAIDNSIRHALGRGIADMQAVWNDCVSFTATAVHWIGHEIAALAHDTAQAVEGLHVSSVTNVYKRVNPGLAARVGALAATVAALAHRIAHLPTNTITKVVHEVPAVTHAVSVPDIGAIPRTIPSVKELERATADGLARIKNAAKRLGPTAILGLLVGALATVGGNWIRCSKAGRWGRNICGMNENLLEGLIADALLVVGALSIVEFAKELQAIETEVVKGVSFGIREARPGYKPTPSQLK